MGAADQGGEGPCCLEWRSLRICRLNTLPLVCIVKVLEYSYLSLLSQGLGLWSLFANPVAVPNISFQAPTFTPLRDVCCVVHRDSSVIFPSATLFAASCTTRLAAASCCTNAVDCMGSVATINSN